MVSEDGPGSWKLPLHLPAGQCSCPQRQEERRTGSRRALTEAFEKEIWPPSSPDCYSFVWISLGVSGLRANLKPHNKTENLLPKIKEVMRSFDRNTMAKACMSFRSRMEAVITADGSFNEYIDCQYVSLLIFFYFNKIGWCSTVLRHLKERRKKFRIYRCHPVFLLFCSYIMISERRKNFQWLHPLSLVSQHRQYFYLGREKKE